MAFKYNPTDFMYSSARVRALENSVITRERTEHLLEAKSADDILASLGDLGFEVIREGGEQGGEILREESLLSALDTAYREISELCVGAPIIDFLRYQYDCNNVKAIIKCQSRGVSPDSMLFSFGTVSVEKLLGDMRDGNYSSLPRNMAAAIPTALEAFAETANPQKIDLIIDKACFADMLEGALASGVDYSVKLVRARIDLINIITCIRVIGMKLYFAAEPFMREAFLEGGELPLDFFISGLEFGVAKLFEALEFTPYSALAREADATTPLYIVERVADDIWLGIAKEAKYIPFGAPVLVGYITALEYEVKNIRIIMAGKDAGLSPDAIRVRLRSSYV